MRARPWIAAIRPVTALRGVSVAFALAWAPAEAVACSCANMAPQSVAFEDASRVIAGYVAEVGPAPTHGGLVARFVVSDVWKGPDEPEITVRTSDPRGGCGLPFTPGSEWVLYVGSREGLHGAGGCSQSTSAVDAAKAQLGPPLLHYEVTRPIPPFEAALRHRGAEVAQGRCGLQTFTIGGRKRFGVPSPRAGPVMGRSGQGEPWTAHPESGGTHKNALASFEGVGRIQKRLCAVSAFSAPLWFALE